jgi:hypothetical protein
MTSLVMRFVVYGGMIQSPTSEFHAPRERKKLEKKGGEVLKDVV